MLHTATGWSSMRVFISDRAHPAAPSLMLEVQATDTVAYVKELIEEEDGTHPQLQMLSFRGAAPDQLEDHRTLGVYNITDGAILSLRVATDRASLLRVLGLPVTATTAEIKAAHHRLARMLHPDRQGGDRVRFQSMQDAYEHVMADSHGPTATAASVYTFSGSPASWDATSDWLPQAAHNDWTEKDHALYEAVWRCDVRACLRLLQEGARPDAYQNDQWGGTTLMLAAQHGDVRLVAALLQHGASPFKTDSGGIDARRWARRRQQWKALELLEAAANRAARL